MPWQPDILPRAPPRVAQPSGHGWGAWRAPLAQTLLRHHTVGAAAHEPDLPPVAHAAPGQTPGTAPQGRDQPTHGARPACQKGRLDRRAALALAPRRATTAWAPV